MTEWGWEPAARDAADGGDVVDDDEGHPQLRKTQVKLRGEIRGQPEEIEPPHGIGEELADRIRPRLTMPEQIDPGRGRRHFLSGLLVDVLQFVAGERGMVGGLAVLAVPHDNPEGAEES